MISPKILTSNQQFALNLLVPSLYLLPLVVAYVYPKYFGFGHRWLVQTGLGMGLLGVILWIVSMWDLGSSFDVMPDAKKLMTRGIYKYIRHPMYLGITLTVCGLMLACGSVFGMIYLVAVILPVNAVRVRLEERALTNQFGELYLAHKKNTWF